MATNTSNYRPTQYDSQRGFQPDLDPLNVRSPRPVPRMPASTTPSSPYDPTYYRPVAPRTSPLTYTPVAQVPYSVPYFPTAPMPSAPAALTPGQIDAIVGNQVPAAVRPVATVPQPAPVLPSSLPPAPQPTAQSAPTPQPQPAADGGTQLDQTQVPPKGAAEPLTQAALLAYLRTMLGEDPGTAFRDMFDELQGMVDQQNESGVNPTNIEQLLQQLTQQAGGTGDEVLDMPAIRRQIGLAEGEADAGGDQLDLGELDRLTDEQFQAFLGLITERYRQTRRDIKQQVKTNDLNLRQFLENLDTQLARSQSNTDEAAAERGLYRSGLNAEAQAQVLAGDLAQRAQALETTAAANAQLQAAREMLPARRREEVVGFRADQQEGLLALKQGETLQDLMARLPLEPVLPPGVSLPSTPDLRLTMPQTPTAGFILGNAIPSYLNYLRGS